MILPLLTKGFSWASFEAKQLLKVSTVGGLEVVRNHNIVTRGFEKRLQHVISSGYRQQLKNAVVMRCDILSAELISDD